MSRDPDDIPPAGGGHNLVRALSAARSLPADAIRRAARHPERVRPEVIAAIETAAAGVPCNRSAENLIFWGIHALAQARDTALCRPLLHLLRLPSDDLEQILGDAIAATLPRIVASVFDGDVAALEAVIGDREIDEFARWSVLRAMTFLTIERWIDRGRTVDLLRRFEANGLGRAGEATWAGWEEAIALLGVADLAETVEAARQDGRLLEDLNGRDWFDETLAHALAHPEDRSRFDERSFGYLQDAATELDTMFSQSEDETDPEAPVQNPYRDIGRNDPCPCGSGKKFKKCCLGEAA